MLRYKVMQIKQIQAKKESTPGLNNNPGITITLDESIVNIKKKKGKCYQMIPTSC